jgi:serine/threonine protein phosphatase PrpC
MVRPGNEDAFIISDLTAANDPTLPTLALDVGERGVLLAVSDGMGGAEAGEVASALVVDSLKAHLGDDCKWSEIRQSMKCAVEQANADVWEAAQEAGRQGMGATLTAALVHRTFAYVATVGDSRAYIVRNGRIRQVTRDQSYVEVLVSAGVMSRDEAERSPYRNVILQAMGTKPHVSTALGRIELRRGDLFVLCTDGLSTKVTAEEILSAVTNTPSQLEACKRLVALANERGGEDNITILLATVDGQGLFAPTEDDSVSVQFESLEEFKPDI